MIWSNHHFCFASKPHFTNRTNVASQSYQYTKGTFSHHLIRKFSLCYTIPALKCTTTLSQPELFLINLHFMECGRFTAIILFFSWSRCMNILNSNSSKDSLFFLSNICYVCVLFSSEPLLKRRIGPRSISLSLSLSDTENERSRTSWKCRWSLSLSLSRRSVWCGVRYRYGIRIVKLQRYQSTMPSCLRVFWYQVEWMTVCQTKSSRKKEFKDFFFRSVVGEKREKKKNSCFYDKEWLSKFKRSHLVMTRQEEKITNHRHLCPSVSSFIHSHGQPSFISNREQKQKTWKD